MANQHSERLDEIGDQWERTLLSDAQAANALYQLAANLVEQHEEVKRERDEWEQRYEELLGSVGGVWPG